MSAGSIIRESFAKKKLTPLIPNDLATNTQACAASIQVYSGAKAEEINKISCHTVAPIKEKVTRTNDPMVVLQEKVGQQSSSNIFLQAVVYASVRLIHDVTSRRNPDSNSGIYLTSAKVAQCRLVAKNRREEEEAKKETVKKTATRNFHLQQKQYEAYQKCQESTNSLSSSTTKESLFINLINLSSNTLKDDSSHIGGELGELPN